VECFERSASGWIPTDEPVTEKFSDELEGLYSRDWGNWESASACRDLPRTLPDGRVVRLFGNRWREVDESMRPGRVALRSTPLNKLLGLSYRLPRGVMELKDLSRSAVSPMLPGLVSDTEGRFIVWDERSGGLHLYKRDGKYLGAVMMTDIVLEDQFVWMNPSRNVFDPVRLRPMHHLPGGTLNRVRGGVDGNVGVHWTVSRAGTMYSADELPAFTILPLDKGALLLHSDKLENDTFCWHSDVYLLLEPDTAEYPAE